MAVFDEVPVTPCPSDALIISAFFLRGRRKRRVSGLTLNVSLTSYMSTSTLETLRTEVEGRQEWNVLQIPNGATSLKISLLVSR